MNTSQHIETLSVEREKSLERAKMILEVAEDGGRKELTAEEQATQDKYLDRVESINRELGTLERIEKLEAARAVPVEKEKPSGVTIGGKVREPGIIFAQMALAIHRNGGDRRLAAEWARTEWGDPLVEKVLATPPAALERTAVASGDTSTSAWAGYLVEDYQRQASEFIDMLRADTVISRIQPRVLTFGSNAGIKIPKQTSGVAGGWLAEGGAIAVEKLQFSEINLTPSKLGTLVVISEELANESSPAALEIIRNDLIEGTRRTIDSLFVSNTAAGGNAPAGILNGISAKTASAAGDAGTAAMADLETLETELDGANVPGGRTWLMNPAQYNALLYTVTMKTYYDFIKTQVSGGSLNGHPIIVSTSVPAADVILVASDQIIWATGQAPTIELSRDATLMLDDSPASPITGGAATSLFQTDQVATRLITSLTWARRHDAAVAWIDDVSW